MNDLLEQYNTMADSVKQHSERVSACAVIMAKYAMPDLRSEYGLGEEELTEAVRLGCLYHDIGKLSYSPIVVLTRTEVTAHMNLMARSHVINGYAQIKKYGRRCFKKDKVCMRVIADIVLCHHEQCSGGGYPNGLSSNDIPSSACLCAMANKLDSLYVAYGESMGFEFIEDMIKEQSGRYFTVGAVEWFIAARDELAAFYAGRYETVRSAMQGEKGDICLI